MSACSTGRAGARPSCRRARHLRRVGLAHGLHRHGLRDERAAGHEEAEARAIEALEVRAHRLRRPEAHRQRRIRALVLEVDPLLDPLDDAALCLELPARTAHRAVRPLRKLGVRVLEAALDGLLAQRAHLREAHAVRGKHARQRVDVDLRHAQLVGHEARVLPARAARSTAGVLGHVVARAAR